MTLYFIPGLGADHRVFERLVLPARHRVVHLDWIKPLEGESLQQYSMRMSAPIDTSEPFSIIGLSMGGMVATEIAQVLAPVHTVLLSSATSAKQLPYYERWPGALHLEKIFPGKLLKQPNRALYWLLGAEDESARSLVRTMQHDTDADHFKWSLRAILDWTNDVVPPNLTRIHGAADRIIPQRNVPVPPENVVPGGGHLAVFTHAAAVSGLLAKTLKLQP
jgi:pimeloyl-ACP methyl ester carboxylesterase